MRRALAVCLLAATAAYAAGAKNFVTPEEAVQALVAAARANDSNGILAVLGPEAREIVRSGDAATDRQARGRFVKAYREANKIAKPDENTALLLVGKDEWIFPIPIVKDASGWHFDVAEGKEEILNRRIGRNELHVIQAVQAYVDAQKEYYLRNPQHDKLLQYAQRLVSSKGRRDGLYFPVKSGEKPSPLGPLFDRLPPGEKGDGATREPYHGYYYRILKGQGPDARGGAYSYLAQGRMIGGFALVAWPAAHGNTGVMTFIVNQDGVVYQKDLGPDTQAAVQKIDAFDPDKSWKPL
ncbi:MAG TPA: DUF2950 domain-containing protein [Burkholderiales bacterium]|nr:DUF2950 domain-containing protein [Burkholderiales bacterium]